jgi:flagellar hook-length control protein FliK
MNQNLSSRTYEKTSDIHETKAKEHSGDTYKKDDKKYIATLNGSDSKVSEKQNSVEDNKAEKVESKKTLVDSKSEGITNDDTIDSKIIKLEDDIKNVVKEVLGITDEELENLMAQLGIQVIDLLNIDNLKNLTLVANQETDVTSILMNENMEKQLSQLMDQISNIDLEKDYGITVEQLQLLMENQDNQKLDDRTVSNMTIKEEDSEQNADQTSEVELEEATIPIEVTKESDSVQASTDVSNITEDTKETSDMGQPTQQNEQGQNNTANQNNNPLDILVNNLVGQTNQVSSFSDQVSKTSEMKEIVTQIVEQIKINIKVDATSMELMLNPENLGKVNLTINQKNGMMTAQFVVENQAVKEAIESQINILRENLENQGLKVEAVEVTVSEFAFNQNTEAGAGNEGGKSSSKKKIDVDAYNSTDDDLDSEVVEDGLLNEGGSINYIA